MKILGDGVFVSVQLTIRYSPFEGDSNQFDINWLLFPVLFICCFSTLIQFHRNHLKHVFSSDKGTSNVPAVVAVAGVIVAVLVVVVLWRRFRARNNSLERQPIFS